MLLYHNRGFLRLIFAKTGSIFGLTLLLAGILAAGVTLGLAVLINENHIKPEFIPHHYGIMVIGAIASFALVYRTNLGWQRYWEAMTQQHFMYSKWSDTFAQFYAFATVSMAAAVKKGGDDSNAKAERINECVDRVERNFSLLSAFAAHRLTHGDNERMEQRAKVGAKWGDRLVLRRDIRVGEDLVGATAMPTFSDCSGESSSANIKKRNPTTMTTTTVTDAWTADFRVLRKLSGEEWAHLEDIQDRVSAVMYWIIHDLAQVSADMVIAPPIQSRMYQELSNGMLGFNNSLKIADVPFPFPYAQLLTWILIAFSCLIPFYVAVFTTHLVMAPAAAFVAFVGMWGINEVAIELENPFGSDDNDISCWDFHERFIDGLLEQRGVHGMKVEEEKRVQILKHQKTLLPADEETVNVMKDSLKVSVGSDSVAKPNPAVGTLPEPPLSAPAPKASTGVLQPLPKAGVAEVCDQRLAEITSRIERRLELICRELEAGFNSGNPEIVGREGRSSGAARSLMSCCVSAPEAQAPPNIRHEKQPQLRPSYGDTPCSNSATIASDIAHPEREQALRLV